MTIGELRGQLDAAIANVATLQGTVEQLNAVGQNSEQLIIDMVNERAILEKDAERSLERIGLLDNTILQLEQGQQDTANKLGETIKHLHDRDDNLRQCHERMKVTVAEHDEHKRASDTWHNRYLNGVGRVTELEKQVKSMEDSHQEWINIFLYPPGLGLPVALHLSQDTYFDPIVAGSLDHQRA